jgi:hypothetical protein
LTRRFLAVLALVLAAACAQPPVRDEMTIEFSNEDFFAVVTASTTFEMQPRNDEMRARVEAARAAALSSTDPWSIRFSRLSPDLESVKYEKNRGALERVTRSVRIHEDDLQQVLSDTSITVDVVRGEGWRELTFYPGTTPRASREQQRRFNSELASWSSAVARYFTTVHHLYSYMDENPGRARYLFAALVNEKEVDGTIPALFEEEEALLEAVLKAMEEIGQRMDEKEGRAATFAEEADLMFNPFPARISIRIPGDAISHEGFADKQGALVIEPIDLFAAIASLEGKWISPDPLAAIIREREMTSAELIELPRQSRAFVPASDIAEAIREQFARPRTYSVRWRE